MFISCDSFFTERIFKQYVGVCSEMEVSNFMYDLIHQKKGAILGWERDGKKLLPTLTRKDANEAWGFSLIGGVDVLENFGRLAGIVTTRNERGMWLKVWKTNFQIYPKIH